MQYDEIIDECKKKARYGDLWRDFTVEELEWYTLVKMKRGKILYERGQVESGIDDMMDAINIAIFSIQKIQEVNSKGEKS